MQKVITLTGASGSGKDALIDGLLYLTQRISSNSIKTTSALNIPVRVSAALAQGVLHIPKFSCRELISYTTREKREYEQEGVDYYFVTPEQFEALDKVQQSNYAGQNYCLTREELNNSSANIALMAIAKKAIADLKPEASVTSVFIKSSPIIAEARMRSRGDSEESIFKRLAHSEANNEYFFDSTVFDYCVDNTGNYINALCRLISIIENELVK